MESTTIKIGGMTCGGCAGSVAKVLKALPGIAAADVSLEDAEARVEFDPAKVDIAAMRAAVEKAGFDAL